MDVLTKALKIITNSFSILGKKIDTLSSEVKRQKAPIVNVESPDVNVNVPDAVMIEFKVPELPEYPAFPEIKIPEIKLPTIVIPEIKVPDIKVTVPEIKLPVFNVPQANVTVTPTPVTFPSEMKVIGMDKLIAEVSREEEEKSIFEEINSKSPLSVQIMDNNGKPITDFKSDMTAPSVVGLKNTSSQSINPATEEKQDTQIQTSSEEAMLLRRMVKLMESQATVDIQNRQRVSIDAFPSVLNTVGIAPGIGVNTPTIGSPINTASVYFQPVWIGPVDQRYQIIDNARLVYDAGIRSHLSFH